MAHLDGGREMLVAEILKDKGDAVYAIGPDLGLSEACAELDRRRVGALIVCSADKVVGVLSERDVVRAVARDGAAALNRPVKDYMTSEVVFASPGETVEILMGRMTDRRIRHLPVLRDGVLSGVVSIGDVVKLQIAEATREAESLRTYIAAG
jgi:CBS domain-containing protein